MSKKLLLLCGSFSPVTLAHLRMFHAAANSLRAAGASRVRGVLSPVGDAYKKPGLLPAAARVRLCALGAAEASSAACRLDVWEYESQQAEHQPTLSVLNEAQRVLAEEGAFCVSPDYVSSLSQCGEVKKFLSELMINLPALCCVHVRWNNLTLWTFPIYGVCSQRTWHFRCVWNATTCATWGLLHRNSHPLPLSGARDHPCLAQVRR